MTKIPLFNLERQVKRIEKEVLHKWQLALSNTEFTGGRYIDQLEKKAAKFFNTKYALGVANGTASLFISLKAAGVGPGDEVITTPLTFCATADAIKHVGAKPVFVDVQETTGNIDPKKIEAAITKKTKVILIVHFYGVPCELTTLKKLAKKNSLILIEDASHAHGSLYKNKPVGSWGLAGCFSLYPSKMIGSFGNAGLITSNNQNFIQKAQMYANHGIKLGKPNRIHYVHGFNELIDNIQAAVILAQFRTVKKRIRKRRLLAQKYNETFKTYGHPGMFWPDFTDPSLYVYAIKIKARAKFIDHMKKRGIGTGIYYPLPLHLQPSFSQLGYNRGDLPIAESFASRTVSIPLYSQLTKVEVTKITIAIQDFLK
jgi:dTDP-4-amino-4,6-dideoxygalactose transaminase